MSSKKQNSFDENFKLGKVLGKGAFGKVRAVEHIGSGKPYAAKIMRLARVPHGFMQQIKNEAAVMKKLHHKNICKFHKFFFGKGSKRAILVMEIAEGQVLSEFVKESHLLEVDNVRKITQGIMKALAYMHARHITHRDIKPDNIFLKHKDDFSSVKIGDFGLSKDSKLRMKMPCGTIQYCAPELLLEPCRYSNAVDIWSAGVVLIQLLVGFHPFVALKSFDFDKVAKNPKKANLILKFKLEDMRHYSDIPEPPRQLLAGMMVVDPSKRVTAKVASKCPFLASSPADDKEAAVMQPRQERNTDLVLPTILTRSTKPSSPKVISRSRSEMSPEQEELRRDMRIILPKAVGRHESARARPYANTDKFSPQHMQARSKRSDFMGPRANLKSRGHEGGPNVAGASKTYQIDRRMNRTQRGRRAATNAEGSKRISQRVQPRSKRSGVRGPRANLKSRGRETTSPRRNITKLPKSGPRRDGASTNKGRAKFNLGKQLTANGARRPKEDGLIRAQPRVKGPMSPRIAARRNAVRRQLHMSEHAPKNGSVVVRDTAQPWRANMESPTKRRDMSISDLQTTHLNSPRSATKRRDLNFSNLQTTYLNSPSRLGKSYFSEAMSPSKSRNALGAESAGTVAEKARAILMKSLHLGS